MQQQQHDKEDGRTTMKRHNGQRDYFLTQALTGHGSFKTYTKRLRKSDELCIYYRAEDIAEHTIFRCNRWEQIRLYAEMKIGAEITTDTLVGIMLEDKRKWKIGQEIIYKIMSQKEEAKCCNKGQDKRAMANSLMQKSGRMVPWFWSTSNEEF